MWDDNVRILYEGKEDVYDGDLITTCGVVTGSFSYESVAGWQMTIPSVQAEYCKGI